MTTAADPASGPVAFQRVASSRLYGSKPTAGAGWWGWLVPLSSTPPPPGPVTLDQALSDVDLAGSFIYATTAPDVGDPSQVRALIEQVDALLNKRRAVVWLSGSPADSSPSTTGVQFLTAAGGQVRTNSVLDVALAGSPGVVNAAVNPGSTLTVTPTGDAVVYTGSQSAAVTLEGSSAPTVVQNDLRATLSFSGDSSGTFGFDLSIQRRSLHTDLAWGFQLLIPNRATAGVVGGTGAKLQFTSGWLPLADGETPSPTDFIGFRIQLNPVNPQNLVPAARTVFMFTGRNDQGGSEVVTRLVSYYRTAFGKTVSLYPAGAELPGCLQAGLVPNAGYLRTPGYNGFSFSPVGDFFLAVDAQDQDPAQLLCGLSGSETISFLPQRTGALDERDAARLRFVAGQPAYAPRFPLEPTSPVGPPLEAGQQLLSDAFRTSWANVLGGVDTGGSAHYAAAPRGADLFGKPVPNGSLVGARPEPSASPLLVPREPGVALPGDGLSFPLFPTAGFEPGAGDQDLDAQQLDLLERQIVSPTRRSCITGAGAKLSPSATASLGLLAETDDMPFNTTTPTGFIARVDGGSWRRLLLAQVMDGGQVARQIGFVSLQAELQAAFQTDNLFLVVANDRYLGAATDGVMPDDPPPDAPSTFYNTIQIGEWVFDAQIGRANAYGDYRNVMIVKGVPGRLIDLVTSPEKWTQKERFAAPTDAKNNEPDISQLGAVSNWLAAYFDDALRQQDNAYFADFCRIISDPAWQGVLWLKVDLAGIPKDLLGLLAGVSDPSRFFAHHLGVQISQVDGDTVEQRDSSSLFGLVHYVDPGYDDTRPPHAITPRDMTATFEVTVSTLKALFRDSSLQRFESVAQVVLNSLFGSRVCAMGPGGNSFNAVVLQGAYQLNGSVPVYALAATAPGTFLLSNNILLAVDIDTASMATRDDGTTSGEVVSWLTMSGRMVFAIVRADGQPDFDIFSFGNVDGGAVGEAGLSFSGLGLRIASPTSQPGSTSLTLQEQELSLSTAESQPRASSLFHNLQLELSGLVSADKDSAPADLGFLTVATTYGLQGVQNRDWHGLSLRVNLGTPGALAGKLNLTSTLLVAWADTSGASDDNPGFAAQVGLQLPGTGPAGELFSLQTVLKLSIGAVRLLYNPDKDSFLLLLNEIALKFLGLLKVPPNGSTSFFLFGNPAATDPTGLGWYAIYNQDKPKPPALTTGPDHGRERIGQP